MKLLILFYSYGGNTRQIAKLVQQETGGDLCEIEIATLHRQLQRRGRAGTAGSQQRFYAEAETRFRRPEKLRYCDTGHAGLVVHLRTSNADTAPEQ